MSNFLPDHTRRFLSIVMPSGTCLELRIFKAQFLPGNYIGAADRYSSTLAGWYDSPDSLIADAARLRGVSGFVTFNPVNPALLARSDNKLTKAKHTTTDDDITAIRWLYVDIDPVRPADISATNEELELAIAKRDQILSDFPEFQEFGIWGRSGNGTWMLIRVDDCPTDEFHRGMISRTLAELDHRYSDNRVKIDTATKNPARVMCLPGTAKCKGSHRPERPWRISIIDGGGLL